MSINTNLTSIKTIKNNYKNTHTRNYYLKKLKPNIDIFKHMSPSISNNKKTIDISGGNYLDTDKLCSIDSSKYGEISGCSIKPKNIFKTSRTDFVSKISDDSFASQFLPLNDYSINNNNNNKNKNKNNKNNNNNKNKNKNNKKEIMGMENDSLYKIEDYQTNTAVLNSINKLHTIDKEDYNQKYCYDKYQNLFSPST